MATQDIYQGGRLDRVMIAVNSAITSTEITTRSEAEILWVKIQCVSHRDIYIAACYRPMTLHYTPSEISQSAEYLMSNIIFNWF